LSLAFLARVAKAKVCKAVVVVATRAPGKEAKTRAGAGAAAATTSESSNDTTMKSTSKRRRMKRRSWWP